MSLSTKPVVHCPNIEAVIVIDFTLSTVYTYPEINESIQAYFHSALESSIDDATRAAAVKSWSRIDSWLSTIFLKSCYKLYVDGKFNPEYHSALQHAPPNTVELLDGMHKFVADRLGARPISTPGRVEVGVGVLAETLEGFVLLKRKGSHGEGEWAFPGGKVDFGESVLDCAARELLEETGLVLRDAKKLPLFTEESFPEHNRQFVTLYVYGWALGVPTIMEPEKAMELRTIRTHEELPMPRFTGLHEAWQWLHNIHGRRNLLHDLKFIDR